MGAPSEFYVLPVKPREDGLRDLECVHQRYGVDGEYGLLAVARRFCGQSCARQSGKFGRTSFEPVKLPVPV